MKSLRKMLAMMLCLSLFAVLAPETYAQVSTPNGVTGQMVADYATNYLVGKPYGGNNDYGPDSFQCNGLVWCAYNQFGIDITKGIDTQPNQGTAVPYSLSSYEDFIKNLLPGDLIFFYYPSSEPRNYPHHVAIYVGNGEVVQAQRPGYNSVKSPLTWTWTEGKQEWQLTCSVRRIISGGNSSYLDQCTPYQSYVSLQITKDDAWLKSLPCSGGTDPASKNVVNSALPVGTKLTGTALYLNDKNNYWYKVRIDSGTYAGNEGYVYAGDVSTTLKSNFTYSGKTFPSTLPAKKAYDVDWTIRSDYLKMDTIAGYIYSGSNYSTLRYSGTINGVNTTSRNLQGTSVDNGLRFDLLEPGNYRTVITATATNYYSVDGKSRSSSSVSGTPISFVFQAVGDSTPTTYTVSYNANGGTGAPSSQTKTHGVDLTLSSTKPSRANASAGSYTVYFSANGGSVSTTSKSAARTTSYSFKNWNTAQNGSGTSYPSGGTYSANAGATLYAQWNSSTSTAAISLPTPTRDGYTFKGWSTSSTATSGVTGYYTPSGNVTLYAVWVASGTWGNLNWTLDGNGKLTISGSGAMSDFESSSSTNAWRAYKNQITSVQISSGITSIGVCAFDGCDSLTSISIPSTVTSIGNAAFLNCESLSAISIPNSVTNIGTGVFCGCVRLTSIVLPDNLTSIGDMTFRECGNLKNIYIPASVKSIGNYAFYLCDNLNAVYYGGTRSQWSVINIGTNNSSLLNSTAKKYYLSLIASGTWGSLNWELDTDGLLYISCAAWGADMNDFTSTSTAAWRNYKDQIIAVESPGATSVGAYAFFDCKNLKSVEFTFAHPVSLGDYAFADCTSLQTVSGLWDNVTFGKYVFKNAGFTSFIIPYETTSISYGAFFALSKSGVYFDSFQCRFN